MIRTIGNKTKKIYLGHLSKENNIKELAYMTMENQLARADFGVGTDFKIFGTSPDTATPLTDIQNNSRRAALIVQCGFLKGQYM